MQWWAKIPHRVVCFFFCIFPFLFQFQLAFCLICTKKKCIGSNVLPRALNICMPPYFPSKSTVLLRGLNALHIRTKTTSKQPGRAMETHCDDFDAGIQTNMTKRWRRNVSSLSYIVWPVTRKNRYQRSAIVSPVNSPDLSRRIWSFWHSSMNPEMRLANSTTYWIAWVIWMAHCCHSTSRGWNQKHPVQAYMFCTYTVIFMSVN